MIEAIWPGLTSALEALVTVLNDGSNRRATSSRVGAWARSMSLLTAITSAVASLPSEWRRPTPAIA